MLIKQEKIKVIGVDGAALLILSPEI